MYEPVSDICPGLAGRVSPGIARSLAHIERHFTEAVYVQDLAALAGLSVCRFVTVFRQQVGLTPHRFICHRRIRYAQALLREGVPLAQAASEAGFFDQSHLSRHFKSVCGITPGRYLREQEHAARPQSGRGAYLPTATFQPTSPSRFI